MSGRTGMSQKRLIKELRELEKDLPQGVKAGLKNTDNLFEWYAQIRGPSESVYDGGVFDIDLSIPGDYPFRPPRATFKTKVYHMNINSSGGICLDILKNQWSPALSVLKVILSILSLLTDPNPADPLVGDIARLYMQNRPAHDHNAREWTKQYAKPANAWPPVTADDELPAADPTSSTTNSLNSSQKGKAKEGSSSSAKTSQQPQQTAPVTRNLRSRVDRPIVLDDDDEDDVVQVVGVKRSATDGTESNGSEDGGSGSASMGRNTRPRPSNSRTGTSTSGSHEVITLD